MIGLKCLNLYLRHRNSANVSCISILKENGYDQLIYIKLRNMLYKTDLATVEIVMENLNFILTNWSDNLDSKSNSVLEFKATLNRNAKVDEILLQLLDNVAVENDQQIIMIHLNLIQQYMFPLCQCNLLKFVTNLLKISNHLLEKISHSLNLKLSLCSLNFVHSFLTSVNCLISISDLKILLENLLKIVLRFECENRAQDDIYQLIERIFILFESTPHHSANLKLFRRKVIESEVLWKRVCGSKLKDYFEGKRDGDR